MIRIAAVAALCLLVAGVTALSQERTTLTLTMAKVMTAQQYEKSGVSTLKPEQKKVLNRWLNDYTLRVLRIAQEKGKSKAGGYSGVGNHWLKSKTSDGSILILEDGSTWEVQRLDRIYTRLWLPITNVMVIEPKTSIGQYKYYLVNTDDGEKVLAKYLGKK